MEGSGSQAKIGTFDTNPDAAQAVKDGKIQFYIDQQPYLQGYMAVTQLYLYKKNGNILGGGKPVLTGPSFVDKSNIDAMLPVRQEQHSIVRSLDGGRASARPTTANTVKELHHEYTCQDRTAYTG